MKNVKRFMVLWLLSTCIIGGAAIGLAATANAAATEPTGPGYSYSPAVKAHPAPSATPGWRSHHGVHHINDLNRQMGR